MLYLCRLELRNIRCFEQLVLEFDNPTCCTVLVGDNGEGKSTVLRSLALGLCDQSSASALFRELAGDVVRRNTEDEKDSFVQVDLVGGGGWRYRIKTHFLSLEAFERIEQTHFRARGDGPFFRIKQNAFPWTDIFVSGYGPGIRTFGNENYSRYRGVDAVYSLFRYDAALQSPELMIRRLVDEAGQRDARRRIPTLTRLKEALASLLKLEGPQAIDLDRRGIFVRGPWGREELSALGDGYRATTTWTLDLMSWWLLYDDEPAHEFSASDLSGIVIIDELEQHLHPRWQQTILAQLRHLFPSIQFIVATHSPLVASSCPDVTVHHLARGEHDRYSPYGWRAEDVYSRMGVPSRAPSFQKRFIAEFTRLDEKRLREKLSRSEAAELRHLRAELVQLPPDDPTRLMLELANIARSLRTDI